MARPWRPTRAGPRPPVTLVAGLVLYAAAAGTFDPYTWPMRVATAVPVAAMVAWALAAGWHRPGPVDQDAPRGSPAGMAAWGALIAVVAVFQVGIYVSSPRETYPTLSSLAGQAFGVAPVRAAAFGAWILLGAYLVGRR